ncbi:MAG: Dabb family protein [Clostridia bacterium]|nr:Dabb family protein [Clostridia bacterium]
MVRHVILWTLKSDLTNEEKSAVKRAAKERLEALYGTVPSLVRIEVHTGPLETSNCDMMLDSLFEDEEGLAEYASHPAHVAAANACVRPYTAERKCFDFKE